jgi:hypothetical protein
VGEGRARLRNGQRKSRKFRLSAIDAPNERFIQDAARRLANCSIEHGVCRILLERIVTRALTSYNTGRLALMPRLESIVAGTRSRYHREPRQMSLRLSRGRSDRQPYFVAVATTYQPQRRSRALPTGDEISCLNPGIRR